MSQTAVFKQNWMITSIRQFELAFPKTPIKRIKEFLERKFKEDFKDTDCVLYNNYEQTEMTSSLSRVIDWAEHEKPIMTESGTFFKKHSDCDNPEARVLLNKLNERDKEKTNKFKFEQLAIHSKSEEDEIRYKIMAVNKDLAQSRIKVIVNSYYGVSGMRSSFAFNLAAAASTTLKGQTLISSACAAFENFVDDGVLFHNMDDCLVYIDNILNESQYRRYSDEKYITDPATKIELFKRLKKKFKKTKYCIDWILNNTIERLNQEDVNRLYFKNNLYEFIRRSDVSKEKLRTIYVCCGSFIDPNKPPKTIRKKLDKLTSILLEYIHYNYSIHNRAYRLKSELRKSVKVIDTDSNILTVSKWVHFVEDEVINTMTKIKHRTKVNGLYRISAIHKKNSHAYKLLEKHLFKNVNIFTYILSVMMNDTMVKFVRECNVEDDAPGSIFMKSEFLFGKLLTTAAKKHYMATILLQEGRYFPTPKEEIKGMEYKKRSYSSPRARKFISKLVYNDVLLSDLDIPKILRKVGNFESKISNSVMSGSFEFFKVAKVRPEDGYKKGAEAGDRPAMRVGPFKATYAWNTLYPNKQVELPGRVRMVKVTIPKLATVSELSASNPKLYERFEVLFSEKHVAKSGLTSIGIPLDEDMPEWVKKYITMDEIISNNTKLITPILESLELRTINRSKKNAFYSNILSV